MTEKTNDEVPKLTTDQALQSMERLLQEMNESLKHTKDTVDKMKNEMENPSNLQPWDSLAISLMLTGAGFVFSGASLDKTNVILGGLVLSLLGIAVGLWRVVRQKSGRKKNGPH
jgi:putative Mn2+ efflux pump MntP